MLEMDVIQVKYCAMEQIEANVLMKALRREQHQRLGKIFGLHDIL